MATKELAKEESIAGEGGEGPAHRDDLRGMEGGRRRKQGKHLGKTVPVNIDGVRSNASSGLRPFFHRLESKYSKWDGDADLSWEEVIKANKYADERAAAKEKAK